MPSAPLKSSLMATIFCSSGMPAALAILSSIEKVATVADTSDKAFFPNLSVIAPLVSDSSSRSRAINRSVKRISRSSISEPLPLFLSITEARFMSFPATLLLSRSSVK